MAKISGSQVFASRQPTRELVGLIVDGNNAAAAVKTIVAAEACWSTPNMDGTTT